MCIAIYKPEGLPFPSRKTLRTCFENNPDGAGFMVAHDNAVHIRKGFQTFGSFWKDLRNIRDKVGDSHAFVMHFRISTQAGTRPDCTHPFPLSRDMNDLRQLRFKTDIGIAHNGIISLTSHAYSKTITYSDTMEFVTDYASRLIKGREWNDDPDTVAVIEGLAGSRLAIMDGSGTCTLLGSGWVEDGGIWYSNTSYKPRPKVTAYDSYSYLAGLADKTAPARDKYAQFFDKTSGKYYFDSLACPATEEGNTDYCSKCAEKGECYGCY